MSSKPSPTGGDESPLVVLDDLVKQYGEFTAVDHIDLEAPRGRVFGVLGPNGAGKTTTMRMITGLLMPTSGRIELDGIDMRSNPVAAKRLTGFIPDRPYIYDKLTAFEYLRFIGGLYDLPADSLADRIVEMLDLFELREWRDELVESFSHGMKQRLVFAGALLPDPQLLVIDEPMVGLDPKGHRLVKQLFQDLAHEQGMSVLLSTHTLEVAEEVCDEIVILNHGKIIARGTLRELQIESGANEGSLEEVFLALTDQNESERAEAVAARFGED
ncbi:MAG: ABC transporter ATP-binding protein [Bradymonadaceae bacterium]